MLGLREEQGGTMQTVGLPQKRGRPRKIKPEQFEVLQGTKERREPWKRGVTRRKIKAFKKGVKHKALRKVTNEVIEWHDISISDAINKVHDCMPSTESSSKEHNVIHNFGGDDETRGVKHKALRKVTNEVIEWHDISISDPINKVPDCMPSTESSSKEHNVIHNFGGDDETHCGDLSGVAEPRNSGRLLGRELGMVQSDVNSVKSQSNMTLFGCKSNGSKPQTNATLQTSTVTFLDNPSPNEQSPNKTQLSFVKTCPLWELLGSMEVFKTMPQRPHFRPLDQCMKECREGLAIGYMVNFVNLVSMAHDARFDDTFSFKNKLELLEELEQHGFRIQPLQARFEALLKLKQRHGVFESELTKIEAKVREQENELEKLDIEIIKLDMDKVVLKESIAKLREKRALIISQSEIGKSKIVKWQKETQRMKKGYFDAKREFEAIVATF
ncbi:DUF724 domain-containing protein 3-like isoform X2 [Aristolochia californica]|uniref:DUF724 domain-containing protein 3-like isoform X2 n=1 Tax=Aristolochia californica TaxID=171875 RepID=UPI0035DE7007